MTGATLRKTVGPGTYVGWYTTDDILWDYRYNAIAHQRWLNLVALVATCAEERRVTAAQVRESMTVTA